MSQKRAKKWTQCNGSCVKSHRNIDDVLRCSWWAECPIRVLLGPPQGATLRGGWERDVAGPRALGAGRNHHSAQLAPHVFHHLLPKPCIGVADSPRPTRDALIHRRAGRRVIWRQVKPPPHPKPKILSRGKNENFESTAQNEKPILGTQTFFFALIPTHPAPTYAQH